MDLETKETNLVRQEENKIVNEVKEIKITSAPTFEKAKIILKKISDTKKALKSVKEKMMGPSKEKLVNIKTFFEPMEISLNNVDEGLREKMMVYNDKIKKEAEDKKAQIAEKVESGDVNSDKASQQIEKAEQKVEAMPTRKIREIEIVDEAKIPKQYWELNMVLIRKNALDGVEIPGVKVVEREIIVSK